MKLYPVFCVMLLAIFGSYQGQAQADAWNHSLDLSSSSKYQGVTELAELDEASVLQTFYVAQQHPLASDENPGSQDRPFRTLKRAATAVRMSLEQAIPTKLVIAEGVYREKLGELFQMNRTVSEAQKNALLILEGVKGKSIISGAIEAEESLDFRPNTWKPVAGADYLYVHEWPYLAKPEPGPWINTFGFAMLPGVVQRAEMLWVNGKHLRQRVAERYQWEDPDGVAKMLDPGPGIVDTSEKNQPGKLIYKGLALKDPLALKEPYTFAVYNAEKTPVALRGKVFLKLDRDIRELRSLEVAGGGEGYEPLLAIRNRKNVLLRGLTFRHNAGNYLSPALVLSQVENFLLEDCDISENATKGLILQKVSKGIIRRCSANENAGNGFTIGNSRQILLEDIETNFNNYRGAWGGFLGWDASGYKNGNVHNITIRRQTSIGNYANGVWFDIFCTHILIENSFYLGNKRMGVMIEFTRPKGGPQVVRNNVVAYNNTGVFVTMAANSVVEDNLILDNQKGNVETDKIQAQLLFKFRKRKGGPQNAEDWQSVRVHRNVIAARSGALVDYIDRKSNPKEEYPFILKVLDIDHNRYWLPDSLKARAYHSNDGAWLDMQGWKQLLASYQAPGKQESHSQWHAIPWEENPALEFTNQAHSPITQLARKMGVPLKQKEIKAYWERMKMGLYDVPHIYYTKQFD